MKNRPDTKLPREDWVIGMIQYNLHQKQQGEKHRMYGPLYLDRKIEELEELLAGRLPDKERTKAVAALERYRELRAEFGIGSLLDQEAGAEGDDPALSPWAVQRSKNQCKTYVAQQIIIDRIARVNREYSKLYSDAAYFVRRKVWGYLHCGEQLEIDTDYLVHCMEKKYDVREIDDDTVGETILEARQIFRELMLTPQD